MISNMIIKAVVIAVWALALNGSASPFFIKLQFVMNEKVTFMIFTDFRPFPLPGRSKLRSE